MVSKLSPLHLNIMKRILSIWFITIDRMIKVNMICPMNQESTQKQQLKFRLVFRQEQPVM